ncbi:MAG: hypothetical protein ABEJ02_03270 [Candidatus Paceibacteria bacterium]
MADLPSEREVFERTTIDLPTDINYTSYEKVGRGFQLLCLLEGNYNPELLSETYRSGGVIGVFVNRTDDLIDGDHGFPEVPDKKEFLYNQLDIITEDFSPNQTAGYLQCAYNAAEIVGE